MVTEKARRSLGAEGEKGWTGLQEWRAILGLSEDLQETEPLIGLSVPQRPSTEHLLCVGLGLKSTVHPIRTRVPLSPQFTHYLLGSQKRSQGVDKNNGQW